MVPAGKSSARDWDCNATRWLIMIPDAIYRLPIMGTRMRWSVWRRFPSRPRNRFRGRSTTRSRNRNWCGSVRRRSSVRNARAVGHRDRRSRTADRWLMSSGRTRRRGTTLTDRGLDSAGSRAPVWQDIRGLALVRMSSNTHTWFTADTTDQANDVYG